MLQKAVLRPDSTLVVCYGLWTKWLRVRVRAGARECTSCSVVDTPVSGFFLEMSFRERNCFCGERKCEKHPAGRLNLLLFGGKISPPKGPEKKTLPCLHSHRKCTRRVTYGHSIDAWSWINVATPLTM